MGVSFKISKVGARFCPKPSLAESPAACEAGEDGGDAEMDSKGRNESKLPSSKRKREELVTQSDKDVIADPVTGTNSKDDHKSPVQEVSFTLDLFPDGFSIGKPTETGTLGPSLREMPKSLHPYNKSSEALFSAIEMGQLPGDILDDIPCKYFNGSIFCEVRDYRKCNSKPENVSVIVDEIPIVHKVRLHMTLENIVKDIPSITDDSWSYGDLMEVESRILKATQPQLCLDPIPVLDKLSETPVSNKLELGICQVRKKRLKLLGAMTVTSNNQTHGNKISIDRMPETVNEKFSEMGHVVGDGAMHAHNHLAVQQSLMSKNFVQDATRASTHFSGQPTFQSAISYSKPYQDRGSGMISTMLATNTNSGASSQDVINSYANNTRNVLQGMGESLDIQMAHMAAMRRSNQTALDGLSQQSAVSTLDSIHGVDSNRKTMMQHQIDMRGIQYSNVGSQKYPLGDTRQIIAEGSSIQEGMASFYSDQRIAKQGVKEERMEMEPIKSEIDRSRDDSLTVGGDLSQVNQSHRQPQQQAFVRAHFPNQSPWNNLGSLVEKDHRKDEQLQKRRSVHSPRVSGGAVVQPPVSKSGDNSSGSMGPHCGPVSSAQGSQKDRAAAISGGAGGIPSVASSPNDSVQRQHQPPGSGKRKPSSVSKNPSMGGVASPASVSNANVPLNANSPSVGTPPLTDQVLMERFSKIDAVTMRFQLNSKKNKVDECTMKPAKYSSQEVSIHLSNALNNEDVIEENNPFRLSNSLIGGSLNTCRSRTIDFVLTERLLEGNGVSIVPKFRDKLTFIKRSRDGMVALVPGEVDENGHVPYLDLLPAFPNTYYADLLGAQFCHLMVKEGYQIMDDRVRAVPTHLSNTSLGSCTAVGTSSDNLPSEAQYAESVSGQLTSVVSLANSGLTSMAASQNVMSSPRLLPPGSSQGVQMSQGFFPGGGIPARPPTLEQTATPPQPSQQSHVQQNQQSQMPKSMLIQNNPISHLGVINQSANINMSNSMVNKASLQQLRLLQQQQHQQSSQMPRKMVVGLGGAIGMGNIGNNTVGLGGLNSVVGMGGIRGIGPGISTPMGLASGISAPMGIGSLPGVSSLGQNSMNMSQNSSITNVLSQHVRSGSFTHAQAAAVASKFMQGRGGTLGGQAGITGMAGNNQMHSSSPLSMLGQNLNRGNMNPMQRTAMATMGPPKIPGMNVYMNQQQQAQLQQQQLQHLQQQQLLQQQQQQQRQQQQQQQQQQQPQQHQEQQQIGSPLQNPQTIVSPSQVGSPAMSIQQQLSQQQQIGSPALSQQNPMSPQLSAGALQQMNNVGNAAGPAPGSPQLSSQTLGSVGSISSSPMELQGVNK